MSCFGSGSFGGFLATSALQLPSAPRLLAAAWILVLLRLRHGGVGGGLRTLLFCGFGAGSAFGGFLTRPCACGLGGGWEWCGAAWGGCAFAIRTSRCGASNAQQIISRTDLSCCFVPGITPLRKTSACCPTLGGRKIQNSHGKQKAGTPMRWRGPPLRHYHGRINNILWPNPERGHLLNPRRLMHVHDSRTPSSRCCGNFLYMTTRCTFRTMGLRAPKDQHGRGAAAQAPMQAWHNCNSRERKRVLPARSGAGQLHAP
jgi:hypothetical protein